MSSRRPRRVLLLSGLVALACAHHPVNAPLPEAVPDLSRPPASGSDGGIGLVLGFSGGGSRAAALAYGVLEELARTEVPSARGSRLIDEVDVISAVSGGSFTAAYYGLHGDRIFAEFPDRFLTRNVQGALMRRVLAPWHWIRLASPHFGRSELAAEYYDEILFDAARFADLRRGPGSPFILIQATDLAAGARFDFSPTWFDAICSDLESFPISRAVAASSALPGVLSPVTLVNHADQCRGREIPEEAGEVAVGGGQQRRARLQRELRSLRDAEARPYVHLLDGGIADNLSLRAVLDFAAVHGGVSGALEAWRMSGVRRLAVVIVDAQTHKAGHWSQVSSGPSTRGILSAVTGAVIGRYNFETVALLHDWLLAWRREREQQGQHVSSYVIEVSFEAIADPEERRLLSSMPTTLRLGPEDVERLRRLAHDLLARSSEYQRLLADIGADARGR